MASPVARGLTVSDLEQITDDDRKHELIGGELYVTASPMRRHSRVASHIGHRLWEYAERHGGEVHNDGGIYFSERDFLQPDAMYLSAATTARTGRKWVDVPPDLVVEVSSPSTRRRDRGIKLDFYSERGVVEYWFVDLDADRIDVYRRRPDGPFAPPLVAGRGDEVAPPHLPGLVADVEDLLGQPE